MTALLAAVHFVGPLLFFTDLTRNPYFTQIALVNIGLAAAAAMWIARGWSEGRWTWVQTPLDWPWAALASVSAASWLYAYAEHPAFFRQSELSEGLRAAIFLAVNSIAVYYLAVQCSQAEPGESDAPLGAWAAFALFWGGAWTLFPQFRGAPSGLNTLWPHLWDAYGALLWGTGLAAVLWLTRRGRVHDFWHLIMAVGFLASVYAIMQYFGMEIFWPKILNPYGGRSVSTFGNPNFMSSYMLMLLPLALTYYLQAGSRGARLAYALVFLGAEASLLCSLTRSSWAGAVAALLPLALSAKLRRLARQDLEFHGLVAAAVVALAALWPQSTVQGYAPSLLGRVAELKQIVKPAAGEGAYSPLYQRLLIWLCAWTMGAENPLTGKGFGLFELFYPFYQGHYLLALETFRTLRTHANNAHNEVLELFSQTGILGLGAGVLLWTAFFRRMWSALRAPGEQRADSEPVWALAAAGGALGMLVDNLLNVSMHFAVPGLLLWWQAGTAMGILSKRESRAVEVAAPRPKAGAAAALALAGACFVTWHWTCQWQREWLYFDGFKLMRRGDAADAVGILERAYSWHKREVNTNYELGNAYARSDRYDKAVWAYKEALAANAGYDEIYFNVGTLESLKLGRRDEALDHMRVSWVINPLSDATTGNYAALLLQRGHPGDREEAERILDWGHKLSPANLNVAMTLASLRAQLGRPAEAVSLYAGMLSRQPNLGAAEQGLRQTLAAAHLPPPPMLAKLDAFRKLEARIAARDYGDETLRLSREAEATFPDSVAAAFYRGNLELLHGDAGAAARLLGRVVAVDANNQGARLNLGQAFKRLGRPAEAAEQFRQVLAADPNNAMARAELSGLR